MTQSIPLLKGTLDILVLKALSLGSMHGFEIASWLDDRSDGTLEVDDSALYYAVHRMEERGLIVSEWRVTETNRRARYYRITAAGRAYLRTQGANMERYARVLTTILAARPA